MDIFDLDQSLIKDYEKFARSFTQIRAEDIRAQVDQIYAKQKFWPEPLITINPHFERGPSVQDLVNEGSLHKDTARVFAIDNQPITLHRHQAQAVAKAVAKQSYVVTTGTGSGKSLCFFIPIIDAAIRAKAAGEPQRTRAIIVYPMNALANSQMKELQKFIEQSGLPENLRPTFARYTGQESEEERVLVQKQKPDILLTNFMMLELLMTRQNERDRTVINNAQGLDFIVLDELHTYRGRQGADVAMLIRRVRDRLSKDKPLLCIGTSATMASDENKQSRSATVAGVASKLFGTKIFPDAVIDESLQRATDPSLKVDGILHALTTVVKDELPDTLDDASLRSHPLAVWIELEIGLQDGQRLARRQPVTVDEASERLATQTGHEKTLCKKRIQQMLGLMSLPAKERGGSGERAFLAFKLHRFISGAGHVYSNLKEHGQRRVTLDGQKFDPHEKEEVRLYSTFFCRSCGQEHHPVSLTDDKGIQRIIPRSIDDTPIEEDDAGDEAGYLMPEPKNDPSFVFGGDPEDYPEEWTEPTADGGLRIKSDRRGFLARPLKTDPTGTIGGTGRRAWFLPGRFRLCPACGHQPAVQSREINKLAGLSAEGRSSATTLLVSSAIRWMNAQGDAIPSDRRKLLGFTDNRQDAALQSGHFNDFLFVSLLRAAILYAVRKSGKDGLSEDEFGRRVQEALGFVSSNLVRRREWMMDPDTKGVSLQEAEKILSRVLYHRVWADQRGGWRFTNPSLEELGLISVQYLSLDELAADSDVFAAAPEPLRSAQPEIRKKALGILLDTLRHGLAITTDALNSATLETLSNSARQLLRDPWSISAQEKLRVSSTLMIDAPKRADIGLRAEPLIVRAGPRSSLARKLNRSDIWGEKLTATNYIEVLQFLLRAAAEYQLVRSVPSLFDTEGWQLAANAVRLIPGLNIGKDGKANNYFISLYESLYSALVKGGDGLFGLEGREHTAQVDQERREWREWRFRWGQDDQERLKQARDTMRQVGEPSVFLPVLFCSPTMELGVDISALNTVYLRNVPPTPANYAQRSGRAGRSGQAALVVTYCAAQSPHDQYYFATPRAMVSGVVRPPTLELANRDLVVSHLHAVWLAETGQDLASDIPAVLDLKQESLPIEEELASKLRDPSLAQRAAVAMRRILDSIDEDLKNADTSWAKDRDSIIKNTADLAPERFSFAFKRWRELYNSARSQLIEANRRSEMHGLSAADRKEAKIQQAQANEQLSLLEKGKSSGGSDFYTYRYLATEGFLPGYNFPRLPLYAYVPAIGMGVSKGAYLQRARFLAIAEFGPGSIIYHEGRSYRVYKAKLPAGLRAEEGGRLATDVIYVCGECGASHHQKEVERCHACQASMAGVHPIRNVIRIDNVETRPVERITANDEERQKKGFDIQTVFHWPMRDGVIDVSSAIAKDADGPILRLDYAPGATISRVNKGLKRRREQTILGFGIDPASGRWTTGPEDGADEERTPDGETSQRIVPIVQDNKNTLLLRMPGETPSEGTMITLQHALARSLEIVFQLEEGETLTEPVPSRDNRRAILAFEATEGGAGVLGRLAHEPLALSRVAKEALNIMHYQNIERAVAENNPDLLEEAPGSNCVKGCYRCLLSYYNQPDHEFIDRTDQEVRKILLRLARGKVEELIGVHSNENGGWIEAIAKWGVPLPDKEILTIGNVSIPLVWRSHLVAASHQKLSQDDQSILHSKGYSIIVLPEKPGDKAPSELLKLLGMAA